jgi:hypothetical protein
MWERSRRAGRKRCDEGGPLLGRSGRWWEVSCGCPCFCGGKRKVSRSSYGEDGLFFSLWSMFFVNCRCSCGLPIDPLFISVDICRRDILPVNRTPSHESGKNMYGGRTNNCTVDHSSDRVQTHQDGYEAWVSADV